MPVGLKSRFSVEQGKFQLTGGTDKVADAIWFYCIYDRFRVYTSDYGGNFIQLVQKPTSTLLLNKTLILGRLQKGIAKYVPYADVQSLDVGYNIDDRREYMIQIVYLAEGENSATIMDVTFV